MEFSGKTSYKKSIAKQEAKKENLEK